MICLGNGGVNDHILKTINQAGLVFYQLMWPHFIKHKDYHQYTINFTLPFDIFPSKNMKYLNTSTIFAISYFRDDVDLWQSVFHSYCYVSQEWSQASLPPFILYLCLIVCLSHCFVLCLSFINGVRLITTSFISHLSLSVCLYGSFLCFLSLCKWSQANHHFFDSSP